MPPPIRSDAAKELDRRILIGVDGVMIVVTRLQFDIMATRHTEKFIDVSIDAARSARQNVDQILTSPLGDVEAVLPAAFEVTRHAGSLQERPPPVLRNLHQHQSHHVDKFRNLITQFPFSAWRKAGYAASEVDLEAVEVVVLDQLTENVSLQFAHPRHSQVPKALFPPHLDHPVGMHLFDRMRLALPPCAGAILIQPNFAEAVTPKAFELPLLRFRSQTLEPVDPLLALRV